MGDFFEAPPPPPEPRHEVYRSPPWFGPPEGMLPGIVALELVLARSDRAAVCVTRAAAYPDGEHGGGGGGGSWMQRQWLWPLPADGTLELVVEWPAVGIELTRTPVETAPIREAAARAQVVFEYPEPPSDGPGIYTIT